MMSYVVFFDFFRSLSRVWIQTHFSKEIRFVNFLPSHRLRHFWRSLHREQKKKIKCSYQEYLDDSDGKSNAVCTENVFVFSDNSRRLLLSLKRLK